MSLYEVVLQQSYANQQCVNKWNFISSEIPAGVSGAFKALVAMGFAPDTGVTAFGADTIAGKLQGVQNNATIFVQAIAKNIYDPTDYYTYAFPTATYGTYINGQPLSPVCAYSFATNRSRADIHRGQKRFVGVNEGAVGDVGAILSTVMTMLQALGDTMADISLAPSDGSAITYTPYVFGTEEYTAPSGKPAYKYFATAAAQTAKSMRITQWTPKDTMRTQVSRQYGHGK